MTAVGIFPMQRMEDGTTSVVESMVTHTKTLGRKILLIQADGSKNIYTLRSNLCGILEYHNYRLRYCLIFWISWTARKYRLCETCCESKFQIVTGAQELL